jgi:hypothetical protein
MEATTIVTICLLLLHDASIIVANKYHVQQLQRSHNQNHSHATISLSH